MAESHRPYSKNCRLTFVSYTPINNLAVTTQKIADGAVTTPKMADGAVTMAKIADNAVAKEKINADVAGNGLGKNATDGSLEVKVAANGGIQLTGDQLKLTNTGDAQILLGDGTDVNARTLSGDISLTNTGAVTTTRLQGRTVANTTPANGQVLTWDNTNNRWSPQTPATGGNQQWYQGTSTPTAGNPAGASSGDYYYDTNANVAYLYDGSTWNRLGGFAASSINMGSKADNYRVPLLYIGDVKPVDGDNIGEVGDFYYCRDEKKTYSRFLDGTTIKWRALW